MSLFSDECDYDNCPMACDCATKEPWSTICQTLQAWANEKHEKLMADVKELHENDLHNANELVESQHQQIENAEKIIAERDLIIKELRERLNDKD